MFCFFQVFLNISTACLTPEQKIVFGVEKVFKKSNRDWVGIAFLLRLFKTCLDLFRIFSCLDFIDFCHVYNTYVHRIFMKMLYSFQHYIEFFHRKNKWAFKPAFNKYILFFISIKAISTLRLKIALKISTLQAYTQAEKILWTYFRLEWWQNATQFYKKLGNHNNSL